MKNIIKTKKLVTYVMSIIGIGLLIGCGQKINKEKDTLKYQTISQKEAKKIMDERDDIIILDVRTMDEFHDGHIKNATLLPYDEIKERALEELPDKNKTILVYCRSGSRSKVAAGILTDLGYTDVYEFGGIMDWKYSIEN